MSQILKALILVSVVVLCSVGGAVLLDKTKARPASPAPDDSALRACTARTAELEQKLGACESTVRRTDNGMAERERKLRAAQQDMDAREAALVEREKAAEIAAKAVMARIDAAMATSFGDGNWEVGRDIQPGKYRTNNPDGECYWEKHTGKEGLGAILSNENESGPTTVILSDRVPFFRSNGCGIWMKID